MNPNTISNVAAPGPSERVDSAYGDKLAGIVASASPAQQGRLVSLLIGRVYESATPPVKTRLLERLVAPLGVLAAAAVANGVFARIKLHAGWPDLQQISVDDVVALADRVQQLGSDALLRVGEVISSSPVLASSTATVLLMSLLLRAARNGQNNAED